MPTPITVARAEPGRLAHFPDIVRLADGRLLVVEGVVPTGNEPSFTKQLDLNMLVIPGGKERTADEYRALFEAAGFQLSSITPTGAEVSVIEGRPV